MLVGPLGIYLADLEGYNLCSADSIDRMHTAPVFMFSSDPQSTGENVEDDVHRNNHHCNIEVLADL